MSEVEGLEWEWGRSGGGGRHFETLKICGKGGMGN